MSGTAAHFDDATALRDQGEGCYEVELDERFTVVGLPNGGYLLAVAAGAAEAHLATLGVQGGLCLAASAAYARALECGPADVRIVVDRRGTRVSQVHAEVGQKGRCGVRALLTVGRLRTSGVRVVAPPPMPLAPLERCARVSSGGPPGEGVSILDRVDLRLDPTTPLRPDAPPVAPEVRAWLRLDEDREWDARALLFLLDAVPPATLPLGSTGWVPTIQLTATIRALPASTWLQARQVARWVSGGLVQQACELWDERGELVAEATQLSMVRFG